MLREGEWGRVVRLFYHIFYGEGFVVKPGCSYQRQSDEQPFAGKSKHSKTYSIATVENTYIDLAQFYMHTEMYKTKDTLSVQS